MFLHRSNYSPVGGFVHYPCEDDADLVLDFIDESYRLINATEDESILTIAKAGGTVVNPGGSTVAVADNFLRIQGDGLVIADDAISALTSLIPDFAETGFTVLVDVELVSSGNEDSTLIEFNKDGNTETGVKLYYDEDIDKMVMEATVDGVVTRQLTSVATIAEGADISVAARFFAT